jgi:hypothetical protein
MVTLDSTLLIFGRLAIYLNLGCSAAMHLIFICSVTVYLLFSCIVLYLKLMC